LQPAIPQKPGAIISQHQHRRRDYGVGKKGLIREHLQEELQAA
jgi:hypothetical protein